VFLAVFLLTVLYYSYKSKGAFCRNLNNAANELIKSLAVSSQDRTSLIPSTLTAIQTKVFECPLIAKLSLETNFFFYGESYFHYKYVKIVYIVLCFQVHVTLQEFGVGHFRLRTESYCRCQTGKKKLLMIF
jgi:hypothetical protein